MLWTVVLEKTLESPLDYKEIQPVHPKRDQPWVFIGKTDVEAQSPILWPPDAKSWLILKDLDAGKDWGQEEKGTTEDEMVGWHHWFDGHGFGWTLGVLVDREAWGAAVHGVTKSQTRLSDWNKLNWFSPLGLQRIGHDWATKLNWLILPQALHPCRLLHNTEQNSLCYIMRGWTYFWWVQGSTQNTSGS